MTAVATPIPNPPAPPGFLGARFGTKKSRLIALAVLAWILVSLVRVLADADDLTSATAFRAALRTAIPVMLAGLGGLFAERCGVINIGLEGMMVLGTWFAGYFGWQWGPWWAILAGFIGGALGGLLHALATVTFGIDHIVSGVAINVAAPGVTRFLAQQAFTGKPGGSISTGPTISGSVGNFTLPFISGGNLFGWRSPNPAQWIERKHWFFVSDLAGMIHGLTSDLSWFTVLALLTIPLSTYVLWRTPFGLRLRSCGEKPSAADSLGIDVYRLRYIGVTLSGGLAGLGGAYLAIVGAGRYSQDQVSGRGFIGLAMLIFGNWRPVGVFAGSALYGFIEGLRLCCSQDSIRSLVILVALILALGGVWAIYRRSYRAVFGVFGLAAVFAVYYFAVDEVPREFTFMAPYLLTLIVLIFASKRLRPPAEEGRPWHKGDA
jgi:simple sugar transport system permease protein